MKRRTGECLTLLCTGSYSEPMPKNDETLSLDDSTPMNLGAAVKATGFSPPKFKSKMNLEKLQLAGASTEGTGAKWEITPRQLKTMGWLNEDGSKVARFRSSSGTRDTVRVSTPRTRSNDIANEDDLEVLHKALETAREKHAGLDAEVKETSSKIAELRRLEKRSQVLKTRRSDAAATLKAVEARFETVKSGIQSQIEMAERNKALLASLDED